MSKTRQHTFEDYEGFVEKFKPKRTTDDCYTPAPVYDAVVEYVGENIVDLSGKRIVRPFYPGGDYQAYEYQPNDVVIDNPPYSILSKIIDFYLANGIEFFLFAPSLTLFSSPRPAVTCIVARAKIIYENGANVLTSFVTNMEHRHKIIVDGQLGCRLTDVSDQYRAESKPKAVLKKRVYPDEVVTSALLGRIAARGLVFKVPMGECAPVSKLDNQTGTLFGGGYLLSERATAERAAAERAAAERVELSEREKRIIQYLGRNDEK